MADAVDVESEFDSDDDAKTANPEAVADAAAVASKIMITDFMAANPDAADKARAKGAVCIVVSPSLDWCIEILSVWQRSVMEREPVQPKRWAHEKELHAIIIDEVRTRMGMSDGDRDLSRAASSGHGALIITHDLDLLTATERAAADVTVTIPPMHRLQLRAVAAAVGSGALPSNDNDNDIPPPTPAALRLCGRPGQSAADFLERLQAFVIKTQPPTREKAKSPGLDGLYGMDEAVTWGRSLARDLQAWGRGELAWEHVDRGALLSGPPGTGKTTFAKRLAAEAGVSLVATSYSEWQAAGKEGHLGELTKELKGVFKRAARQTPCILFIDELDSVQSRGSSLKHQDWWTAIINSLLAELDGVEGREGIVVVAASNHADRVDPALKRAGRLDREIRISLPSVPELCQIMASKVPELAGVDFSPVGRLMIGRTGADCERVVRGARRRSRHAGRPVQLADFIDEVAGSTTSKPTRRTAIHEAAHAVALHASRPHDIVALSIRAEGDHLGGLVAKYCDDATETGIEIRMMELLAGRAAEEIICGMPSAGAGGAPTSDLARCTQLAVSLEVSWGLGGSLMWLGDLSPDEAGRLVSLRADLADRVETRLTTAHGRALTLVRDCRRLVEGLAAALMEREVLTGDEVRSVLASLKASATKPRIVGKRAVAEEPIVSTL